MYYLQKYRCKHINEYGYNVIWMQGYECVQVDQFIEFVPNDSSPFCCNISQEAVSLYPSCSWDDFKPCFLFAGYDLNFQRSVC